MNPLLTRYRARFGDTAPYQAGAAPAGSLGGRLSSNEAPLGPSPSARAAVVGASDWVGRYPSQTAMRAALADYAGTTVDRLIVTNGSDELCYLLAALALEAGSGVVLSDPCYRIDEIVSRLFGADIRRVPLVDGRHDLAAMAVAARPGDLVWLPTPHNPTGCAADPAELARFLDDLPADCVVVLDEAYRAYADPHLQADSVAWTSRHAGLVVQRTMSKDHALAGLRVGYAIAAPDMVAALDAVRPPFDVNAVAADAVVAALIDPSWAAYGVALVRRERALFERFLTDLGVPFYPSQANFVTIRVAEERLHDDLAAAGLSVRPGKDLGLPGWTRVTIGTPPQMVEVRQAVRVAMQVRR